MRLEEAWNWTIWTWEEQNDDAKLKNLKDKVSDMEILEQSYLEDRDELETLFDRGLIEESGCLISKKRDEEM